MLKQQPIVKDAVAHARKIKNLKYEPKLTVDQVDDIRCEYVYRSSTHGMRALAKKYGVSQSTIFKIIRGKTWKLDVNAGHAPLPEKGYINWKHTAEEMRLDQMFIELCDSLEPRSVRV